jgi:hypothetical protein
VCAPRKTTWRARTRTCLPPRWRAPAARSACSRPPVDDSAAAHRDEGICGEHLWKGISDEGISDEGIFDEGIFDEGIFDEGIFDEGVFDEGVFDEGVFDEGVFDEGVFDEGVFDEGVCGGASVEGHLWKAGSAASRQRRARAV